MSKPIINTQDLVGKIIRVYWNLHTNMYSVQTHNIFKNGWRVIGHTKDPIYLEDVLYKVGQAGRKKVLQTGIKNVHAYVQGRIMQAENYIGWGELFPKESVTYNPFLYKQFVKRSTKEEVFWSIDAKLDSIIKNNKRIPQIEAGFGTPVDHRMMYECPHPTQIEKLIKQQHNAQLKTGIPPV